MAQPKSLVFHLHKYWDIIDAIARTSLELPALDAGSLERLITRTGFSEEAPDAILRALLNADILQTLVRSDNLQLNPLVLDFVRGLTYEHHLGLASVLAARVDAVRQATENLLAALESGDTELLCQSASQLSEQFRQITQQLSQDRHAIQELAEQAKSADSAIPPARRYRKVLDAYENYLEPMNQMMDSSASGTFYIHLEKSEQALDRVRERMEIQGALYTHRLLIRQVAWQAKELRSFGRITGKQCADILFPLREEMRAENELSAAISWILGVVRKRGLAVALKSGSPLWLSKRIQRVSVGDEVRKIMAQLQNYHPEPHAFPDDMQTDFKLEEWIDENQLFTLLESSLPVPHLLEWLHQHFPHLPDNVTLRLYHDLVRSERWQTRQSAQEAQTSLQQVRVHHYPHEVFQQ